MKKVFPAVLLLGSCFLFSAAVSAQAIKVGVFDIDIMVQVMPAYHNVDSLVQVYERDSLAPEHEIYVSEYTRLDEKYKIDSAMVANGKASKKVLDYTIEQREKMAVNLYYWQQIAKSKLDNKTVIRPGGNGLQTCSR